MDGLSDTPLATLSTSVRERVIALTETTLRTLSQRPTIRIRRSQLYDSQQCIPAFAPHLVLNWQFQNAAACRGIADAVALRLRYSDSAQFRSLAPKDTTQRWIVSTLEQYRVETLVPSYYQGISHNVDALFCRWSEAVFTNKQTESDAGNILFACLLSCRSRLSGQPVAGLFEAHIEHARAALAPLIGNALYDLRRYRHNQIRFLAAACTIARHISVYLTVPTDAQQAAKNTHKPLLVALFTNDFDATDIPLAVAEYTPTEGRQHTQAEYSIFSTAFDSEVFAAQLVRAQVLHEHRQTVNRTLATSGINRRLLASWIMPLLAVNSQSRWNDNQEQGVIDGRRLAQIVSSPFETRLFKTECRAKQADCAVSFLLDNSGSMRRYRGVIAGIVDALSGALETLDIASEILGFTTSSWNGGDAYSNWQKSGRQKHPGRVCDIRHICYKTFDSNWRQARNAIAAIIENTLYREGVDGEAVSWAAERLLMRPEKRRILFVFSDGSPMESATIQLNDDEDYLCHHLATTVAHYDKQLEIYGVGVGLDLSPFYQKHLALDVAGGLSMSLCKNIINMLRAR